MSNQRPMFALAVIFTLLFSLLDPGVVAPAYGASFEVTSTDDLPDFQPGDGECRALLGGCTLRAAVQEANELPGEDLIVLPPGDYVLSREGIDDSGSVGDLDIIGDLLISGAGKDLASVDGNGMDRVFDVLGASNVEIRDLTIQGGLAAGLEGGGVRNFGNLTLSRVRIANNEANGGGPLGGGGGNGGGIANRGTLFLEEALVRENYALQGSGSASIHGGAGGGVYNLGELAVSGGTIGDNRAGGNQILPGSGGGVHNEGALDLAGATVSGNTAGGDGDMGGSGGGLYNAEGAEATLSDGSTVSGNATDGPTSANAGGNGGGIHNAGAFTADAAAVVANSIVSYGAGAGLYNVGSADLFSATVTFNDGDEAIYNGLSAVLTIVSSEIGDNGGVALLNHGPADIAGGTAVHSNPGGGLVNAGNGVMTLNAVAVRDNGDGSFAGGITNSGLLTVDGSLIAYNSTYGGGGIMNTGFGSATVNDSTITGNASDTSGGGVRNAGHLTVTDSQVLSNTAAVAGGGIYNTGAMTVTHAFAAGNAAGDGGAISNMGALFLIQSDVRHNQANDGGGLFNRGVLTLLETRVFENAAAAGGGGLSNTGAAELTASLVTDNVAILEGGGVANSGVMTVTGTAISANASGADHFGGGVYHSGPGTLTLIESTLAQNSGGDGGGLFSAADSGGVYLDRVTVAGNASESGGGGISNNSVLTATNSTVHGNNSLANEGGGLQNAGTASLLHVTLSGNEGGGIFAPAGTVTVQSSVIAENVDENCSGQVQSAGDNVEDADTCNFGADDQTNADPRLGPLQDNGGPTPTRALLAGSPAIDVVDNLSCPSVDQRGVARPLDGDGDGVAVCDAGAYEQNQGVPTVFLPFIVTGK